LLCRLIAADRLGKLPIVTLDCVFTRFDERFVAASLDGIVFTDRVLADIKSKKCEARFALLGVKRVG
jgi:hypothetical protein